MNISTRKIGRIKITIDLVEQSMNKTQYSALAALFTKFIPFRIDWDDQFVDRTVTYYGFSECFDEIPEGAVIPFYLAEFNVIDGESFLTKIKKA
jgi:hypothetical protein